MITWGINALNHGSSLAVFENNQLVNWAFCSNDKLDKSVILNSIAAGGPDKVYWYEQPLIKKTRQLWAGQWDTAFDLSAMPNQYLKEIGVTYSKVIYTPHHGSHAAAGYYTSPFNQCAVVVLDAIGEWECASIWKGSHGELKKVWSRSYPNSLGLFYSAFTKLVGLEPIKQENIFQQMSDDGDPLRYYDAVSKYISPVLHLNRNLHKGVRDWQHPINNLQDQCDIAAAVQQVFEEQVKLIMVKAKELTGLDTLVYMGGCAMNSKANKKIVEPMWKYIWSLPVPGDPTSAIGAVLYHTKQRITDYNWKPVKHIEIKI
jgi:carbamoyltransferase